MSRAGVVDQPVLLTARDDRAAAVAGVMARGEL
jgi:hypothetical protein